MNNYNILNNKLYYNDKSLITLNYNIQEYLTIDDLIIILEDSSNSKNEQNIYCYSKNGDFRWRIPPLDKLHFDNYYTSIYITEKGALQAYNKNGVEVTIDKQNGNILQKELIK